MNYSQMSDEELLKLYNSNSNNNTQNSTQQTQTVTQNNKDYSQMSDEELLSLYDKNNTKTSVKPVVQNTPTNVTTEQTETTNTNIQDNDKPYFSNTEIRKRTIGVGNPFNVFKAKDVPMKSKVKIFGRRLGAGASDIINGFAHGINSALDLPSAMYYGLSGQYDKLQKQEEERARRWDKNGSLWSNAGSFIGESAPLLPLGGSVASGAKTLVGNVAKNVVSSGIKRQLKKKALTKGLTVSEKGLSKVAQRKADNIVANFANNHKYISSLPAVTLENTAWGLGNYGIEKSLGHDANLRDNLLFAQAFGHGLHGTGAGINAVGNIRLKNGNTVAENIADKLSQTRLGATFTDALNIKAPEGSEGWKMQQLNKVLSDKNYVPRNVEEAANLADALTKDEYNKLYKELRYGEEVKPDEQTLNSIKELNETLVPEKVPNNNIETLNRVEQALNDGTPITKENIFPENVRTTSGEITIPQDYFADIAMDLRQKGLTDEQILAYLEANNIKIGETPIDPNLKFEAIPEELGNEKVFHNDTVNPEMQNATVTRNDNEVLAGKVNKHAEEPLQMQGATVDRNDTEALVGKINELNSRRTNTGNSRYDNWIAKNKQKHAEGSGSPVKNETGINTHEQVQTLQNEPASHVKTNKTNKQLPKKLIDKNPIEYEYKNEVDLSDSINKELYDLLKAQGNTDEQALIKLKAFIGSKGKTTIKEQPKTKVTKLEPGDAEGSHTSMRDLYMERPDKVETHTSGDKPSEYKGEVIDEVYNAGSHINEDVPLTNRYASDDAEFNKWFDKYEKADKETRIKMQKEKMTDFNSQEESIDFYEKFTEQVDRDKRIAERNQTSPSVTEDDIMNFASNYKAADILPSATKQAKIAEREMSDKAALEHGTEIMKMFGYGKGAKGVNSSIARSVSKSKGRNANKTLIGLIKARLNNFKSKFALDKYVEQKIAEFDKMGGNIAPRAKMLLKDAYKDLSERRGYIKKNNSNLKSDLAYRNQQTRKIDTYSSPSDLSNRKTFALDVLYDHIKELGASIKDGDVQEIGLSIKNAVDIRTGKHFLNTNQNISSYFGSKHRSLIDNIKVIITNHLKDSNGKAAGRFDTILIKNGSNIEKEFNHETQHIIDYQTEIKIDNLPDGNPIKDAKKLCDDVYDKSLSIVESLKNNVISNINKLSIKDKLSIHDALITKENKNNFSLAKSKKIANNIFGKNTKEANEFIEYITNKELYLKDPREVRSYNAENGIQNTEKLEDALLNRANELKGQSNGLNRPSNRSISKRPKPDLSGDGTGISGIFQNTRKTENSRNNITISRGNKTGQKSTSEQPIGLKFLKEQPKKVKFDSKGVPDKPEVVKEVLNPKATPIASGKKLSDIQVKDKKQVKDTIVELSRQGEDIATEMRWITPEQAEARLKMQDEKQGKGLGVYFKQGYNEGLVSGMDVSLNHLENRNVEGLSGTKKLKGLAKRGTAKDIVTNTYKETAKRQYVKDSISFVRDNFAKPIPENGKIPDGYEKINEYALSFAQYKGKGSEFINSIMKGDTSIDANFGSIGEGEYAKALKDLRQYWTKDGEYQYMIPKAVKNFLLDEHNESAMEYFERYIKGNPGQNGGIQGAKRKVVGKTIGAVNDFLLDRFKRGVLTSASFVVNNRFGNQMMIAANTNNPIDYINSFIQAGRMKDSSLPIELRENIVNEAVNNVSKPRVRTGHKGFDTFADLCNGNYIDLKSTKTSSIELAPKSKHYAIIDGTTVPKGSKKVTHNTGKTYAAAAGNAVVAAPNKAFNWISDRLMNANQWGENFERKQAVYIKLKQLSKERRDLVSKTMRQAKAFPELMQHVKDNPELELAVVNGVENMLGNYRTFNKYEQGIFKRFIPFYSWYRTMARHEYQLFKKNPTRWGFVHYTLANIANMNADRPEYQRHGIPTVKDGGKRLLVNKGGQIPYNTYPEVIDNITGEGSLLGGANPYLTTTLESIRGKKFFLNDDIKDRKYVRPYKDANYFVNTETGEKLGDKIPLSVRANYFRKNAIDPVIYAGLKSPMVSGEYIGNGLWNLATKKKWETPDKFYDTTYTGYKNGELYKDNSSRGRKYKHGRKAVPKGYRERYAVNDLSEGYKAMNKLIGTTLQKERIENPKAKKQAEYKEWQERIKSWQKRNKKK